jgi:hypothetical protein
LIATPALAQNDALGELYGHGVHAYNSGDYVESYNLLTRAIDSGIDDPRCFYFRGLSYIKLGREPEAKQDFAKAAELEMADTDRFYNVSKSLERIQGRARAMLEKYRSDARLAAYQVKEQKRKDRYQRIRKNEPNVTLPKPSADQPPVKPADDTPDDEMEPAGDLPAEAPMPNGDMPAENAGDDPFAEPGKKPPVEADEPAESDDPFAEDGAKPDEGDEPKEMSDDPFGDDAKPSDDAEPADDTKSDDDPFGDDAKGDDAGSDEEMADGDESSSEDDPFGDDEPKKKP